MYDLVYFTIGISLYIIATAILAILILKQDKLIEQYRKAQDIDFDQKFVNYIQRNRMDIQNWTNSNKEKRDELDNRLAKLEKIVLPPKRNP